MGRVNFFDNRKAVELTLSMIVLMIIGLIVLVLVIYFFGGNFGDGASQVKNVSDSVLGNYSILN